MIEKKTKRRAYIKHGYPLKGYTTLKAACIDLKLNYNNAYKQIRGKGYYIDKSVLLERVNLLAI